ncbi:unnamed protein product, partial [Medioppia subpectinata]
MEYQTKRGGRVILSDIQTYPKQDGWTPLEAMAKTILVETGITQALIKQNALADRVKDSDYSGFLFNFLREQIRDVKELSDHVTRLKRNVAESQIRQNLHPEIEFAINNITNSEFMAYYFYEQMRSADDLMRVARKFMEYQNKRGGRVILSDISAFPRRDSWTPLEAIAKSIWVEQLVNQNLLKQNALAESIKDSHFSNFLSNFINEEVIVLKELADHMTQLQRAGPGIGEY